MADLRSLEKYKQYQEIVRFNQQMLNNLFKFYFTFVSVIGALFGKLLQQANIKYPGDLKKISTSLRPWALSFTWILCTALFLGLLLLVYVYMVRIDNVKRLKKIRDPIDNNYAGIGIHYVYAIGCAFFNSAVFLLILVMGYWIINCDTLRSFQDFCHMLSSPNKYKFIWNYRYGFGLLFSIQILSYFSLLYISDISARCKTKKIINRWKFWKPCVCILCLLLIGIVVIPVLLVIRHQLKI